MATTGADNALGAFLKARRDQVRPQDAGVAVLGPRRVPGLRRDELAALAGVSEPYLVRLEQGRDRRPSPQVLDALARALALDAETTDYLHALARAEERPPAAAPPAAETVGPGVQHLLDGWTGAAAYLRGRRFDVLAANALATALSPLFRPGRNLVADIFLDPGARGLYADWDVIAEQAVASLRAAVGAALDDAALGALVADLDARSPEFRALWARQDVQSTRNDVKRFTHVVAGSLALRRQVLALPDAPGQFVIAYYGEPGSASEAALARLGSTGSASTSG
jgi:transcriptional regulator with XRE-family HTH domain